jgi:hypothetical protein
MVVPGMQDRTANAPVDKRLAASGILVAIDVRLAREAPYPTSVADAHYGIRNTTNNANRDASAG